MATGTKKTSKKNTATRGKRGGIRRAAKASGFGNGLTQFSAHALDDAGAPLFAKLSQERTASPAFAFAFAGPAAVAQLDPETIAKRYLDQALESKTVKSFTAPKTATLSSEFKSLGTETIPLTGTKTVKFRQTFGQIPVYGSLVTVELDEGNNLLSLNSSMGDPTQVSPVAKIAPGDAIKAVEKYPGYKKQLDNIVPRLMYYFDSDASKWRLVFILEDVPVTPENSSQDRTKLAPQYMDYVVDANTGKIVAELPRTPTMAAVVEQAVDGRKVQRQIRVEKTGKKKILRDASLNVQTFDFRFADPQVNSSRLPGSAVENPPLPWAPSAVSAHANAMAVAEFLRNVLRRNNIDNKGGPMNSSINCVVARESKGQEWFNAFWDGNQMVYGQRLDATGNLTSLSIALDIVGHEMFHGITDSTSRLEYANQSGALNESYSDIFGVIIANFSNPDPRTWNWNVGEGLSPDGPAFRNMKDPGLFGQPAQMRDFVHSANTSNGDWGGVHTNSGIHNKAASNVLVSEDAAGQLLFKPAEVAAIFYLALTQQLSRTSQFTASQRAVLTSARTFFRAVPVDQLNAKLSAIEKSFSAVGISA